MIFAIVCLSIAGLAYFVVYLIATAKEDRRGQVLADLGLAVGIASTLKTPFYKFGWRKTGEGRDWGERIVREAFEKNNVGLSQQDLEYFCHICDQFASGETVDKSIITNYIEKILSRSSTVSNFAASFINPVMERSLNASPAQAKKLLEREKIQSSPENAANRLAVRQFTKMLRNHGMKILCGEASGLDVKGESGEILTTLRGYDSWEFWLKSCRESLEQCLANKALIKSKAQAKFLRSQIQGVIQGYEDHLKKTRSFLRDMESLLSQERLSKTMGWIDNLEKVFYGWHFSEGMKFSLSAHQSLRELLSLPELPSRCRQALLDFITPSYPSLQTACHRFPRQVIFYGANSELRSYAVQQYLLHRTRVIKTLCDVARIKYRSPLLMRVMESDVYKARNPDIPDFKPAIRVDRDADPNGEGNEVLLNVNAGHMPLLLDSQKRMILFAKNFDPASAEQMGWIIDLPIEDFTPKESAQLDLGSYLPYKRINCDKIGEKCGVKTGLSSQQRDLFLNEIFDALLQGATASPILDEAEDEDGEIEDEASGDEEDRGE